MCVCHELKKGNLELDLIMFLWKAAHYPAAVTFIPLTLPLNYCSTFNFPTASGRVPKDKKGHCFSKHEPLHLLSSSKSGQDLKWVVLPTVEV